jgi:hypothetical protein
LPQWPPPTCQSVQSDLRGGGERGFGPSKPPIQASPADLQLATPRRVPPTRANRARPAGREHRVRGRGVGPVLQLLLTGVRLRLPPGAARLLPCRHKHRRCAARRVAGRVAAGLRATRAPGRMLGLGSPAGAALILLSRPL